MLTFVTAGDASMDAFLSVSAESPYQEQLREYVESLVQQGCTRPEWCVLGLEAAVPTARAALWALPGEGVPSDVVLIDADWGDEDLKGGRALLTRMHELAAELGTEVLQHHVDNPPGPPQYQENEIARIRLLVGAGYELRRDGLRWLLPGAAAQESVPEASLLFRGLLEVGEDAFVEAIAATYAETKDSWLTRNIEERGLLGAARADFLDYQALSYQPEWWELAYTNAGQLAGVVMAARTPSSPVIAYIGVIPEQRGHGLALPLVRRGSEQLLASGADEVRGDCDRDNIGMVKAFERAGFQQIARRRTYHRAIAV
jgi:ribosomal protein S18 acetylase RimI-like enzyme